VSNYNSKEIIIYIGYKIKCLIIRIISILANNDRHKEVIGIMVGVGVTSQI